MTNITLLSDMNYKILSPSKYKDNIEILINYKQLNFIIPKQIENRKYNIVWFAK